MSGEDVRQLLERYAAAWKANDRAGWLATFADDATQEDPVGGGVRRGHDEIGGFWDRAVASYDGTIDLRLRAVHLAGTSDAAMEWTIVASDGPERIEFDGVDVFTFAPGPVIATVRAYWGDRR